MVSKKKVFAILLLTVFGLAPVVLPKEVPVNESLTQSEIQRMRLMAEAYRKFSKHYYQQVDLPTFEKFFFRAEYIAGTMLKRRSEDFDKDLDLLIYGTLEWMVQELRDPTDKVSRFIHYKFVQDVVRENLRSKFKGIGIEIEKREEAFFVRKVYKDSSAMEQGIRVDDKIVRIENQDIAEWTLDQVKTALKIPSGNTVLLSLIHSGETQIIDVRLLCRVIFVPSVFSKYYRKEKVAHIQIKSFRNGTGEEFGEHLQKMIQKKPRGLILDLRDNNGGNMEQAVAVCDFFLPPEKLVCYFLKRDVGRQDQKTKKEVFQIDPIQKIVLLVNEKTGSSSEIVTGALRYYNGYPVAGVKTKGMGSLKNSVGLSDRSILYLITSRTFLPDETTFDVVGIEPDILFEDKETQLQEALALFKN